jgi:penicillin-binding protein 1C
MPDYLSKRLLLSLCATIVLVFGLNLIILLACYAPDFRKAFDCEKNKPARFVTDRNGQILKFIPDKNGHVNVWRKLEEIPNTLIQAAICAEDRRFLYHPGFDPPAIIRAAYTNLKHQRKVSGASTISQQVVRLLNPRQRNYYSKLIELLESVKLEIQLSKNEIMELYLNMVPMGGQLRGAGVASLIYFSKDLQSIGFYEAACLAVIPRAPSRLDPTRPKGQSELLRNADTLVKKMVHEGTLPHECVNRPDSLGPLAFRPRIFPNEAPHFVGHILNRDLGGKAEIRTTLDLGLQHATEKTLQSHKNRLRRLGASQAAVMVVATENREVLSMVGSLNYGDDALGYNNGATCFRSAGSTLKPFLYALALSKGFSDSSEIADTFKSYKTVNGDYMPFNANRISYGPVNLRSALGSSLNIPAIKIMELIEVGDFYSVLKRLGLISEKNGQAEKYGLGLSIGAIEIRLCDLVQAYSCLSAGGKFEPLRLRPTEQGNIKRIFSEEVASEITDILQDPLARILTFGNPVYFDFNFPVAIKTGTSSKFRDSWAVGYTAKHVVGVWAGNFDGSPTRDAFGSSSCGPILNEVMSSLYSGNEFIASDKFSEKISTSFEDSKERQIHEQAVKSGDQEHIYLGPAYAKWIHNREKEQGSGRFRLDKAVGLGEAQAPTRNKIKRRGVEIVTPHDGDRFVCSNLFPSTIVFRAQPQEVVNEIIWLMDGKEVTRTPPPYEFYWTPSIGAHSIHAVTPFNEAAQIGIYVESK